MHAFNDDPHQTFDKFGVPGRGTLDTIVKNDDIVTYAPSAD